MLKFGKNVLKSTLVFGGLGSAYLLYGGSANNNAPPILRIEDEDRKLNSDAIFYPLKNRVQHLAEVEQNQYDVLVIGGGCNGAGVLLEGASRGLKCILVEGSDFASGSTSKSTKLIHGGVRYLEQAFQLTEKNRREKLDLLVEALRDRSYMIQNAQYMNRMLPIIIPTDSTFMALYYYAGSLLYHVFYKFAADKEATASFPAPYIMNGESVLRAYPNLDKSTKWGVVYYDGQMNDSRMDLDLLLTATMEGFKPGMKGANLLNYTEFRRFVKDSNGKITGGVVYDKINNKEFTINAKAIVNCTGVFADVVRREDDPEAKPRIMASAGSHLVLNERLTNPKYGLLIPKTEDGRLVFLLPWQDKAIFGTTDIGVDSPSIDPTVSFDEMLFLVDTLKKLYSNIDVTDISSSIEAKWCGLRPLVREVGAQDSKSISRKHVIEQTPSGLISLMGGKWTTYRAMGEETIDTVVKMLEKEGKINPKNVLPSTTKDLPLIGEFNKKERVAFFANREKYLNFFTRKLKAKYLIDDDILLHLVEYYGDRAFDVVKLLKNHELRERIHPSFPFTTGEVRYQIRSEMAVSPIDVLFRRTRMGFLNGPAARESLVKVIEIFGDEYKWDDTKKQQTYKECMEKIAKMNF